MTEAETKFRKARATLILDQPFFGRLLLKINPKPDDTCKTMWTDGTNAGFNEKYIETLTMEELKTKICIQTLRLAAQHHCRRGERSQGTWDRAGEFTVTPILKNAKNDQGQNIFSLPKDALYSQQYDNKEAEAVYTMLKEIEDKSQPPQRPGNDPGQGPPQPDPAGGEVRDMPGKDGQKATDAEKEQQRQDWKIATQQAARAAKSCGKLPGELLRLVDDLLEPVIDWKEALRQFVDRVSRNDYSWRRPNSRYMTSGVILPTLYNQELPPLVIGVDTSGSINQNELKQFAGEIDDILNQYPTTLTVIYCDTQIHPDGIETFTAEDRPIKLNAKGGGGTKFSPVFKHVSTFDEQPACLVYLTDLECSDFGEEPPYPVLWCNTGEKQKTVPWGEVIRMKMNKH